MNGDELKLRVVPEVDDDAIRKAQAELDKLQSRPTAGPKSGVDDALKAELAGIKATIDANDLKLRKFLANSAEEEKAIRRKQALDQLTTKQAQDLIAQETQARENMIAETVAGYQTLEAQLASYDQANQQVINRQKQLFYASERAKTGFSSMSRSMGGLTESTKDANIAFANFGRIVQDAPFGLLGISNNIDPMLVSFARLKESVGGTGLALRALGAQLLGPAGLIFLLGSALPTALLFAQRAMQRSKKQTDEATDSINVMARAISQELNRAVGSVKFDNQRKEIEAIESALAKVGGSLMVLQGASLAGNRFFTAAADATGRTAQNIDSQANAITTVTQRQNDLDPAIRKELEQRLASLRASQLVARELQRIGFVQEQVNELAKKAAEEAERRLRAENESLYIMRLRLANVTDMLDADPFAEFDIKTGAIEETSLATYRNLALQRVQFERQFSNDSILIQQERDLQLANLASNRLALGLADERAYQEARFLIIDQYGQMEVELARMVAMQKAEEASIYLDAVASGLGAIFGENKGIQSAQVVIDSLAGANRAFAALMPNFPLALAAAGSVIANGVTTIRRINQTKKGQTSIDKPTAVKAEKGLPFVSDRPFLATPLATSIGATMLPSNVTPINVEARIDRMGLAVAVRQGESDIATRQIPFAS